MGAARRSPRGCGGGAPGGLAEGGRHLTTTLPTIPAPSCGMQM
jgi:hypothetical protein